MSNPSIRKQSSWKTYWLIFLGACSSFNLPVHPSSHISPDQWRIVKLKVNRTAFAMETKVARGGLLLHSGVLCSCDHTSHVFLGTSDLGTEKLLMIKPLPASWMHVLSSSRTRIWVTVTLFSKSFPTFQHLVSQP